MKKIIPSSAVLIPDNAKRVFEGIIYDTYQWPQTLFDGSSETFEMLKRADTAAVICIVDDDKILVLDDEQPHSGSHKTFPGGRVDKEDADMLTAAQREVHEETGYTFGQWRPLKVWQPHTKVEWFIHLFLAWDVRGKDEPHLDAGEKITTVSLPFDEVKNLVLDKAGYLAEAQEVFAGISSLQELLAAPAFVGQQVDR